MSVKKDRLEGLIRKELSNILQFEVKKTSIGFTTITDVELTRDYSYATIYVSFLETSDVSSKDRLAELEKVKGVIRSKLAAKLKTRKTPELIFKLDRSFDQGARIDEVLAQISEKEEETEE